jgi:4,5-DOPA dioxygenase extradiol
LVDLAIENTMPVIFVGHGASVFTTNPDDPTNRRLQEIGVILQATAPKAIVCISAHYIKSGFSVTAARSPTTIHDHPVEQLYSYHYPAHGDSALADRIVESLIQAGFDSELDRDRGLDHGAWIPLSLLFPAAQIPVVQVALQQKYDLQLHFKLGQILQSLRDEGVLIICSGGITHNQAEFRRSYLGGEDSTVVTDWSQMFDTWVTELLINHPSPEYTAKILDFQSHEFHAIAHPTIEHFLPLMVAMGAASQESSGNKVIKLHSGFQHSLSTAAFLFQ